MAHSHLSSGRSKARLCILYVSDERLKNGLQVGRWRQPFSALLIVPFISTKIIIFPQNGTKSKRSEHMKGRSAPPAHRHFRRAEGRVCISFSNVSGACSPLPRSPASSLALPSRTPLSFLHCHCRSLLSQLCYSLTALHFASESHARCFCFSRSAYHPFFSLNADRSLPSVSGLPSWLSLSCMSFLPLLGHFLSFVLRCVPQCLFVPCDFPFHCSSLFSRLFSALSLYSSLGCSASS